MELYQYIEVEAEWRLFYKRHFQKFFIQFEIQFKNSLLLYQYKLAWF